ncbi:MAG: S8/S53 family peptidase [Acidimicrobiales bacterium]
MSDVASDHESVSGWENAVAFAPGYEGFAYRPDEVVVGGELGRDAAQRRFPAEAEVETVFPEVDESEGTIQLYRFRGRADALTDVDALRAEGVFAQPNHVVFSHGQCGCGPHPAQRWHASVSGHPMYASPMYASPMYASPMYASPMYASAQASPMYASDLQGTGRRRSSARPTTAPTLPRRNPSTHPMGREVRVAVLDTGMAADEVRPAALDAIAPKRSHWEKPDVDGDDYLDPAAGHGTFIAGLIDLLSPGCKFTIEKVLTNYGEGDEVAVARRVHALAGAVDLINLSFGGYAMERMHTLAAAVRRATTLGTAVVASAGNDSTCRPTFPAALPGVVGVGAIGPAGPAPFTNYGPWVRACAPGVDVVSWFFSAFEGQKTAAQGELDPDSFESWARWSGTSFAAPIVTAALAREMGTYEVNAAQAVHRVIDARGLLRLPDLGTVVNIGWAAEATTRPVTVRQPDDGAPSQPGTGD